MRWFRSTASQAYVTRDPSQCLLIIITSSSCAQHAPIQSPDVLPHNATALLVHQGIADGNSKTPLADSHMNMSTNAAMKGMQRGYNAGCARPQLITNPDINWSPRCTRMSDCCWDCCICLVLSTILSHAGDRIPSPYEGAHATNIAATPKHPASLHLYVCAAFHGLPLKKFMAPGPCRSS
jgi:hypothetical protein